MTEKKGAKYQKIIVFVDDLDRLRPQQAVELLEAMKNFLDLKNCVYVLAIDFDIVSQGLNAKFDLRMQRDSLEAKTQRFFDKIIQVPFKMPIERYHAPKFIEKMLENIRSDTDQASDTLNLYKELIVNSVGMNPRTIKRLLNRLQLLVLLDEKSSNKTTRKNTDQTTLILLGILCMMESYKPLYEYIRTNPLSETLPKLSSNSIIAKSKWIEELGYTDPPENFEQFCSALYDCLDTDRDKILSKTEIDSFYEMLTYSTLVDRGMDHDSSVSETFSVYMRREMNNRYRDFVQCQRPRYSKFRLAGDNVVWLELPDFSVLFDTHLILRKFEGAFQLGLSSPESNIAQEFGKYICDKLKWSEGILGNTDDRGRTYYWFIQIDNVDETSSEKFQKSVFEKFDSLTDQVSQLYSLCKEFQNSKE